MREAEFVFNQTNRDLKITARSARHKVRGGGRVVRMPSDNLSRKEKIALNGEVKSYELGKPMGYDEFKAMPRDIQQMYLDKLMEMFPDVPNALVAEMFGIPSNTLSPYLNRNKLAFHRYEGWKKIRVPTYLESPEGEAFMAWACGDGTLVSPAVDVKPDQEPFVVDDARGDLSDVVAEEPEKSVKNTVRVDKTNISNIALLLSSLVGTGAKLTIEMTL